MEEKCTYSVDKKRCNCILHCEKDEINGWYILDPKKNKKEWDEGKVKLFWETIQKDLVNKYNNEKAVQENNKNPGREYTEYIDENTFIEYDNKIFPSFKKDTSEQTNINFYGMTDDFEPDLVKIFETKNLLFKKCYFIDTVDFQQYTFSKAVHFINCNFNGYKIDLSNKTFPSNLFFKNCKNIGKIDLSNSTIKGFASFKDSDIKETNFKKTTFNSIVVFNNAIFENDVNFKYTEFNERVYFEDVTIKAKLNLKTAIFKNETNFLGIKKDASNTPIDVANRETARIIKHSFEKINNIIEANKFYALEMKAREKELKDKTNKYYNLLDSLIFKIHGISSDYSQDWFLVLLWMINITMLFGTFLDISPCKKDSALFITISLIIILSLNSLLKSHRRKLLFVISIFIYSLSSINLNNIANLINPFSIMIGKETLTFGLLIYKLIIAYLIYQFIVSVRQNTRRK